jgi:hypothetical protein
MWRFDPIGPARRRACVDSINIHPVASIRSPLDALSAPIYMDVGRWNRTAKATSDEVATAGALDGGGGDRLVRQTTVLSAATTSWPMPSTNWRMWQADTSDPQTIDKEPGWA